MRMQKLKPNAPFKVYSKKKNGRQAMPNPGKEQARLKNVNSLVEMHLREYVET